MKTTIISVLVASVLIGGAFAMSRSGRGNTDPANNVSIVDGVQIINIKVKGGYAPSQSIAKAGIPTLLRFNTKSTFDCSSSVRIPSMNISQHLPQTGATDINVGSPEVATLQGSCAMGMYHFAIDFQG